MSGLAKCRAGVLSVIVAVSACYHGSAPKGVGAPAPDFTVQDDERKVALDQFRGKVVVLNFCASWCAPCITETPSLVVMQERLKDKGVVVVAISADEDEEAYHRFIKQYGISFVTVREPSAHTQHQYGTEKLPESYVIDRDGILRRRLINAADWNSPEITEFLSRL